MLKSNMFRVVIVVLCLTTLFVSGAHSERDATPPDTIANPISSTFTDVGTAGILTILILREVFEFLRKRDKNNENINLLELKKKIDELHMWHDQRDSDGIFCWYVKQSLVRNIDKLTENIVIQTQTLVKIQELLVKADTRLDRIEDITRAYSAHTE